MHSSAPQPVAQPSQAQVAEADAQLRNPLRNSTVLTADPALRFAFRLLADHGIEDGAGRVIVDMSVRDIAAEFAVSPGTIQSRLRQLDELGVRLSPTSRTFDADRLDVLLGRDDQRSLPHDVNDGGRARPATADRVRRLLTMAADIAAEGDAFLDLAEELSRRALSECAADARQSDTFRATARGDSRDKPRESMNEDEVVVCREEQDYDLIHSSRPRGPARRRATVPRGRTDEALTALLQPLIDVCKVRGLAGVTHLDGIRSAMEAFDDEQVAHAVGELVDEAASGLRTPIGKLVNVARDDVDRYFTPPTEPTTRPSGERGTLQASTPPELVAMRTCAGEANEELFDDAEPPPQLSAEETTARVEHLRAVLRGSNSASSMAPSPSPSEAPGRSRSGPGTQAIKTGPPASQEAMNGVSSAPPPRDGQENTLSRTKLH